MSELDVAASRLVFIGADALSRFRLQRLQTALEQAAAGTDGGPAEPALRLHAARHVYWVETRTGETPPASIVPTLERLLEAELEPAPSSAAGNEIWARLHAGSRQRPTGNEGDTDRAPAARQRETQHETQRETQQQALCWPVTPRPGTLSPWASKATDIARNCGLLSVARIERGTLWLLS
ncbi:MAG: hypothetical protein KDK91_15880, partial [Gammaproteobacteria bacterium]|nr:hypothetical protein [Gammaproteobacteria bacterium]